MNRVFPLVFIMAFTVITGVIVVALLTMGMSQYMHFIAAAAAGAVVAFLFSMVVSKKLVNLR